MFTCRSSGQSGIFVDYFVFGFVFFGKMTFNVILLIVLLCCSSLGRSSEEERNPPRKVNMPIWNETHVDALKRDLLMSYDKFARPHQHYNTTNVLIDLHLKHIQLDETTSIFSIYAWFKMEWNDEKLKWNELNYGNLSSITLAQHEIWQPDIEAYNTINSIDYGNTQIRVYKDGNISFVPAIVLKVFCESNLRYWPYDTHNCSLILGSWVFNGQEINLEVPENVEKYFEMLAKNPEWDIVEFTVDRSINIYTCCVEPYVSVRYNIAVERGSCFYRNLIVAPSFVIILLTLTTFWLPTGHGEKIILNGFTAVIVCIYLIYFSQMLNIMAAHTPLIVLFYSHTFVLVCLSTILSTITINLSHIKQPRPLPWIIKKHLDGVLSDYLLLHHIVAIEDEEVRASEMRSHPFEEHISNDEQQIIQLHRAGKNSLRTDYLKLTTAIDRIGFIVYTLIFMFFVMIYSI